MRHAHVLTLAATLLWSAPASAEVKLTIADGQVSLSAKNATAAQILSEWARVGQTRVVNGERVPGTLLTIELSDVPEAEALDIILRGTSGYLIAPRTTVVSRASRFDRILIVPAVTPATPAPVPSPQRRFEPQPPQPDDFDAPDDPPPGGFGTSRGQQPSTFPQPGGLQNVADDPDAPAPPAPPASGMPVGVSRPGMVVPVPPPSRPPGAPPR